RLARDRTCDKPTSHASFGSSRPVHPDAAREISSSWDPEASYHGIRMGAGGHRRRYVIAEAAASGKPLRRLYGCAGGASDDAMFEGDAGGGDARVHIELVEDRGQVCGHGAVADGELIGDLGIGHPGRDEREYLDLALAQAEWRGADCVAARNLHQYFARTDEGPLRAQRLEFFAGLP